MKKYWQLFKNYLSTLIEYRANLVGIIVLELISIGQMLVLWLAIFRNENEIRGFTFESTLLYYLLVPLIGFITKVNISKKRSLEIKNGNLSNHLVKPYSLWFSSFIEVLAKKIQTLTLIIPIYSVILIIYSQITDPLNLKIRNILLTILFAISGFLLHFFIDLFISWLAFWVTDIWSFKHFKYILFAVFGGLSFPFELISKNVRQIFEVLPFKYFYYIPISYFTGLRDTSLLASDIRNIFIWYLIFIILGLITWKLGLKKYESYGN